MAFDVNDEKLDQILAELGNVAEGLAKSSALKKDAGGPPEAEEPEPSEAAPAPEAPAAPAPEAPAAEGAEPPPADAAAPGPDDMPPQAEGAEGAAPEQEFEQEAAGEQGDELSPEEQQELDEIYGGMSPQMLEQHYMIMKRHLMGHYDKAESQGAAQPAMQRPQHAPAAAMGKGEMPAISRPPQGGEQISRERALGGEGMAKNEGSEDLKKALSEIETLKTANADIKAQYDGLVKANEKLVSAIEGRVSRKAVTDLPDYIKKSAAEQPPTDTSMSREDMKKKVSALCKNEPHKLSKSQRDAVNAFFLDASDNDAAEVVKEILKGGK